jgi:poly(beta-D-mannuronate) lyase
MLRVVIFSIALFFASSAFANTILVGNVNELNAANQSAKPGDTVLLKNGTWNDVIIKLNCSGTKEAPIVFKAETNGKVIISGVSQLRLGGNYIVVEGLLFTNGHSPAYTVIDFKISNKELANHCRVTNCVINDFNKPRRMDDDNWVSFSGKNNRIDHCSFLNKKNMGVLLAVLLDGERSRENFHSIDHNYFGVRLPLASNGGEIIRVGLSQHCQYNSNTQIKDNFFEHCDGEAEVISIKSCANVVSNNVFKECQGSVVLRHGDYNTVTNNLFLGNGKVGTGGVRIINNGQWVINNFFYKCRGESFRAPLVLMNGIPNSPANRYVQVSDAVVMNNTFVDCAPMSFGEGSDKERTLPPVNVLFARNIFYNNSDSVLYQAWDAISGIRFVENKISDHYEKSLASGFERTAFNNKKTNGFSLPVPVKSSTSVGFDSLIKLGKERLPQLSNGIGFEAGLIKQLQENAHSNCGARWFVSNNHQAPAVVYSCKNASEIYQALSKSSSNTVLKLTGPDYLFDKPLLIHQKVQITAPARNRIRFGSSEILPALFIISGKAGLSLTNLHFSAKDLKTTSFVTTDTAGSSEHYAFQMKNVSIEDITSCENLFHASKSTLADSIVVYNCSFDGIKNGFSIAEEKENKGYYNAEKICIVNCKFKNGKGFLMDVYRGGSDESTLGPDLIFAGNNILNYATVSGEPLIKFTGVQKTKIENNSFTDCNTSATVLAYQDSSRARHSLKANRFIHSGAIRKNSFVSEAANQIK